MSKYMTPDAARQELNQLKFTRTDIPPVTHVALTTLAADTVEYTVEALYDGHWREPALGYGYRWTDNYDWAAASLAGWRKHHPNEQFRIIARRISPEWVVTDEH